MAKHKITKKSQHQPVDFHWPEEEIADEFVDELGEIIGYNELYKALSIYNMSGFINFW